MATLLGEGQDSLVHFLEMDENGQLNKVYQDNDRFGRLVREVKAEPEAIPGEAYSLEIRYNYPSTTEIAYKKRLILWTQELEDKVNDALDDTLESIEVTRETILDGSPVGSTVAFLSTVGGVSPINWAIVDDPDNKFGLRNGNEIYLDVSAADIADGSHQLEVMAVDSKSPTSQMLNRIITFQIVDAASDAEDVNVVNGIEPCVTPILYNISATAATPTSQVITDGAKKLLIKSRTKATIKLAYINTFAQYIEIPPGNCYSLTDLKTNGLTLYLESDANAIIEIEQWT